MSELPGGTVTFLFTDIEGSTRLLRRLGERYATVVTRHASLVRGACDEHGGREVDAQGDAFFVAFPRAGDAVAAALDVQRALAAEPWPDGAVVRVRAGLHTGAPLVGQADYVGLAVHRAARICAVGHGGQILVSSATRELLEDDLGAEVSFRDLGECRLKDFDRPEHLYQVVAEDLAADFPPPTSVGGGRHLLPRPPNRTIGREREIAAVAERLRAGSPQLVTLTGPGGVGKTRLAMEAARAVEADFADGAHVVSLAAVQRPEDVPAAVVRTLSIVVVPGEQADQAAERFLAGKHLLLVMDNFEHLLGAAPFVGALLEAGSALTVLATSREPLSLHAEECFPVSALAPPARHALFAERARAHDPEFAADDGNADAVAEICRRVDGLPLAIELAAARCGLLSPVEIAGRLQEALAAPGFGTRDAPARQQTLRATIDWSHALLSEDEQRGFARFAVFAGGATVPAAEAITRAGLDTLEGLVSKSLLVRGKDARGTTRLGMLEMVRGYAGERFAADADSDADAVREDHYRYYLALAQRHGGARTLMAADAREPLARLDAEIENLHSALGWAVGRADAERALELVAALGTYWQMRDRYADAMEWIDRILELPGADAHPALRFEALRTKLPCLWALGRRAERPPLLDELDAIARRLGDPLVISQALRRRVDHEIGEERLDTAQALADEALHWAAMTGDDWEIAEASCGRAIAASTVAELRERVDTAAALLHDVGNVFRLGDLLSSAGYAVLCLGSDHDAAEFAARAAPIVRAMDNGFAQMINCGNLGLAALLTGDEEGAAQAFRDELRFCRDMVLRPAVFEGLRGLAAIAVLGGDAERAATLVGAAAAHRYGLPVDAVEARLDGTFFAPARLRRGPDAWDADARYGATLSFAEAIAYALEEDASP